MVAGLVGAAACGSGDDSSAVPAVEIVPLAGGDPVRLDEIEGPAVVNLWATWCIPCRREMPDFQTVAEARRDVTFVGVNVGEHADTAQEFIGEVGVTYDQYRDPVNVLLAELGSAGMPTTIVIDAEGNLDAMHVGEMSIDELNAAIDDALTG